MSGKLIIGIDITDWRDDMQRIEPREIASEDDIVSLVADDGYSMTQAGRFAVAQEEMGITREPILISRKMMISTAARANVNQIVAKRRRMVETTGGKEYEAREFIAQHRDDDSDGAPVAAFDTTEGLRRATYYILEVVTGHIWNRFIQIHGANGDVAAIAGELKTRIDGMVDKLE